MKTAQQLIKEYPKAGIQQPLLDQLKTQADHAAALVFANQAADHAKWISSAVIGHSEDLDEYELGAQTRTDPQDLLIRMQTYKHFGHTSKVLHYEIYYHAAAALEAEKATQEQINILLLKAEHEGWTVQTFKKNLNKISKTLGASPGSKKTSIKFTYPAYNTDQDLDTYMASMAEAFQEWKAELKARIAEEMAQMDNDSPLFEDDDE